MQWIKESKFHENKGLTNQELREYSGRTNQQFHELKANIGQNISSDVDVCWFQKKAKEICDIKGLIVLIAMAIVLNKEYI